MKNIIRLIVCIIGLFLCSFQATAQLSDTTTIYQITTLDDNEFIGHILSETETTIEFKTATIGIITIRKNQIKKREELISNESTNGLLWTENPMAFRYFIGNSGYSLRKGEAYYQNAWVFVNNFDIGISDRFSLGIGTVPLFLFAGAATPVWLTPRVSLPIESDKVNFGIGGLIGGTLSTNDNYSFGYGFGNLTLGDRNKNLTLGVGYGFADGEFSNRPTFSLSGMIRTGKRGYILTENYIISTGFETVAVLSLGGRFIGKKITIDYGGFFLG